jgi:hypothetical protein
LATGGQVEDDARVLCLPVPPSNPELLFESDYTRPTGDGVGSNTDLADIDAFADEDDEDEVWLFPDEDHPDAATMFELFLQYQASRPRPALIPC